MGVIRVVIGISGRFGRLFGISIGFLRIIRFRIVHIGLNRVFLVCFGRRLNRSLSVNCADAISEAGICTFCKIVLYAACDRLCYAFLVGIVRKSHSFGIIRYKAAFYKYRRELLLLRNEEIVVLLSPVAESAFVNVIIEIISERSRNRVCERLGERREIDRKSTRLNSSHRL